MTKKKKKQRVGKQTVRSASTTPVYNIIYIIYIHIYIHIYTYIDAPGTAIRAKLRNSSQPLTPHTPPRSDPPAV